MHLTKTALLLSFTWLLTLSSATIGYGATTSPDDEIGAYFRVMWGLLIVLAVMLIIFAIFKKRFSIINPRSTKAIRVLEIQPLMPKKSLCLVEVKGKEYLLGIGQDDITLLAALENDQKLSFQETLEHSQNGDKS
jgi:flagellar protein FliO/FliZ